jgi:hypothetical protein
MFYETKLKYLFVHKSIKLLFQSIQINVDNKEQLNIRSQIKLNQAFISSTLSSKYIF